ncbi:hypothetical protein SKAU_G00109100 [Synaphobranchus kaupii]|uniref:Uncharacterized protein n=1 Tax=Synaphobranchus kaupii TaxID=118154 RepID=A0A9Q1G0Q5_SYNKA|nr:hypothetical protein SKAU_G00109100 [Synaphobranchus kaupii]
MQDRAERSPYGTSTNTLSTPLNSARHREQPPATQVAQQRSLTGFLQHEPDLQSKGVYPGASYFEKAHHARHGGSCRVDGQPNANPKQAEMPTRTGSPRDTKELFSGAFLQVPGVRPLNGRTVSAWAEGDGGAWHRVFPGCQCQAWRSEGTLRPAAPSRAERLRRPASLWELNMSCMGLSERCTQPGVGPGPQPGSTLRHTPYASAGKADWLSGSLTSDGKRIPPQQSELKCPKWRILRSVLRLRQRISFYDDASGPSER